MNPPSVINMGDVRLSIKRRQKKKERNHGRKPPRASFPAAPAFFRVAAYERGNCKKYLTPSTLLLYLDTFFFFLLPPPPSLPPRRSRVRNFRPARSACCECKNQVKARRLFRDWAAIFYPVFFRREIHLPVESLGRSYARFAEFRGNGGGERGKTVQSQRKFHRNHRRTAVWLCLHIAEVGYTSRAREITFAR